MTYYSSVTYKKAAEVLLLLAEELPVPGIYFPIYVLASKILFLDYVDDVLNNRILFNGHSVVHSQCRTI